MNAIAHIKITANSIYVNIKKKSSQNMRHLNLVNDLILLVVQCDQNMEGYWLIPVAS